MFVAGEEYLDVGFGAAQSSSANLVRSSALITSRADCYEQAITGP